jgi:DNA repair protein RecO (recombination protein O)
MATSKRKTTPTPALLAYVLHRYDWSESSLIVELFTRERGRLVVAAKGAKRPYSQLRPVLMPFAPLLVQLGRAPADDSSEVHNLRSAEWAGSVPHIEGSALFAGFYANELLLKLLPREDAHSAIFDAYVQLLAALDARDDAATQIALRAFELKLLRELGWLPELDVVTASAAKVLAGANYGLTVDAGVAHVREGGMAGAVLIEIEAALAQDELALLAKAAAPAASALRAPLRSLLQYHLGSTPLRTRRVMHSVHKLLEPLPQAN